MIGEPVVVVEPSFDFPTRIRSVLPSARLQRNRERGIAQIAIKFAPITPIHYVQLPAGQKRNSVRQCLPGPKNSEGLRVVRGDTE